MVLYPSERNFCVYSGKYATIWLQLGFGGLSVNFRRATILQIFNIIANQFNPILMKFPIWIPFVSEVFQSDITAMAICYIKTGTVQICNRLRLPRKSMYKSNGLKVHHSGYYSHLLCLAEAHDNCLNLVQLDNTVSTYYDYEFWLLLILELLFTVAQALSYFQ